MRNIASGEIDSLDDASVLDHSKIVDDTPTTKEQSRISKDSSNESGFEIKTGLTDGHSLVDESAGVIEDDRKFDEKTGVPGAIDLSKKHGAR